MAFGIEIFNQDGLRILGIDDRCPRFHSTVTIPPLGGNESVLVGVPGMTTDGTWFADADSRTSSVENVKWVIQNGGVFVVNCVSAQSSLSITLRIFRG